VALSAPASKNKIMDKQKILVNVTWEDNYGAWCDALPGCVATHQTLEGIKKNMRSGIKFHLEGMREDGDDIPKEFQGEYELVFRLNVKAVMQKYKGILTHTGMERLTGIDRRQIQQYASGLHKPFTTQRKKIEGALHTLGRELLEVEL
jgi:predicted RNase H-like HicB family nuclease